MRKLCAAFALALTLVLPGSDASAWDGVQRLSKSAVALPVVVGNERGRRVVTWSHGGGVFVRVAPRGGRFGRGFRIAPAGLNVAAAMDERGNTALVWTRFVDEDEDWPPEGEPGDEEAYCCVRVMSVVLRRDGRLSRTVEVGAPHAINGPPLISSDRRGRLSLAWSTLDEDSNDIAVYARFGTMRRGFGRLRRMTKPGEYVGGIVAAGRGRVVHLTSNRTVETSLRADGGLRRRVLLDFTIGRHQLGTDDRGRQTGAWQNGETATRTPPGRFRTVAQRDPALDPLVSVSGSGAAVVAWTPGETDSTGPTGLRAFVRPPGAHFARAVDLADADGADDITVESADSAPDGAAAVAATFRHIREPDAVLEQSVYLLSPDGDGIERLSLPRTTFGGVDVLRDARGTLAVVRTADGFVARWAR